jgi:ABC-type Mn2+/Zn2+ transport system ATPase subunit
MIDFKHVTKVYEPKITALKDVSVHIDKGEFVFVLGHSGAGKSTFLKLMLREEKATKGEVIVNGYNLSKIKEKDIPYQLELMSDSTGTNADHIALSKGGIKTGLVSIPLRNMHTGVEVVSVNDVENCARLIAEYILRGGLDA